MTPSVSRLPVSDISMQVTETDLSTFKVINSFRLFHGRRLPNYFRAKSGHGPLESNNRTSSLQKFSHSTGFNQSSGGVCQQGMGRGMHVSKHKHDTTNRTVIASLYHAGQVPMGSSGRAVSALRAWGDQALKNTTKAHQQK